MGWPTGTTDINVHPGAAYETGSTGGWLSENEIVAVAPSSEQPLEASPPCAVLWFCLLAQVLQAAALEDQVVVSWLRVPAPMTLQLRGTDSVVSGGTCV